MTRTARGAVALLALAAVCAPDAAAQTAAAPKFLSFAFINDDHGWAGGGDGIDVTHDGGKSWHSQFRGHRIDQIVIVKRRSVYALADGAVLHTANDGATWEFVGQPEPALKRIAFTSDRSGLGVAVDGSLDVTSDGGKTWRKSAFAKPVDALCFSDNRTGYVGGAVSAPALGAFDGVAKTEDGGRTWADAARPPTAGLVGIAGNTLKCTRGSVYDLVDLGPHAGGGAYLLARSTDGGKNWTPVVTGGQVTPLPHVPRGPGTEATSMGAYSPRAVYVAGFCGACGPAGTSSFGSTTDAGKTWQNSPLDALGFTSAPVFTSPRHGWIGARIVEKDQPPTDEVLVTDDAGRTWNAVFSTRLARAGL
jgi:photosystem II stability/assembly factor-like uncharacterized protein